jgi:zinc protease
VNFNLLLDAGYAADQNTMPGTASMTMDMLDEGTQTRDALQISEELALLGANLGTGSNLDMSSVALSALKENLEASLELFADVILNPSFPGDSPFRWRCGSCPTCSTGKATLMPRRLPARGRKNR